MQVLLTWHITKSANEWVILSGSLAGVFVIYSLITGLGETVICYKYHKIKNNINQGMQSGRSSQLPCEICLNSESISLGHVIAVDSPINKRSFATSDPVGAKTEIASRILSEQIPGESIKNF